MLLLLRKCSIFGQLFTDFCSSFSLMQKECRYSPAFGHICYTQWRIQEDAGDAAASPYKSPGSATGYTSIVTIHRQPREKLSVSNG